MTDRELLELILDKVNNLTTDVSKLQQDVSKLQQDVSKLQQGQAKLENEASKLYQNQTILSDEIAKLHLGQSKLADEVVDLRQWRAWLKNKIEANHEETIDKVVSLKLELMQVHERMDKQETQFKSFRWYLQGSINDLQMRQLQLEEEIDQLKKLHKAS